MPNPVGFTMRHADKGTVRTVASGIIVFIETDTVATVYLYNP
ncbi:predicted protein [Plenodomus lingam JN3]|uniref:Predicted protein n=1 Tax=Leptosphaeria maculans (strain JN3 / isolate v23.1.3 / race Av1-4-5-6-7-8) TaxID=985895 RepID=E5ADB4_LEPMJ|nr:predicted protein [Plenodomus lingam JN3]CBY02466.1 predicted protein [Plenodomus lingam JN3]